MFKLLPVKSVALALPAKNITLCVCVCLTKMMTPVSPASTCVLSRTAALQLFKGSPITLSTNYITDRREARTCGESCVIYRRLWNQIRVISRPRSYDSLEWSVFRGDTSISKDVLIIKSCKSGVLFRKNKDTEVCWSEWGRAGDDILPPADS